MKEITIWETFDEKAEEFVYNHIENGWVTTEKPEPNFDSQKGWPKQEWHKEHAYLLDSKVISKEEGDAVTKEFVRNWKR